MIKELATFTITRILLFIYSSLIYLLTFFLFLIIYSDIIFILVPANILFIRICDFFEIFLRFFFFYGSPVAISLVHVSTGLSFFPPSFPFCLCLSLCLLSLSVSSRSQHPPWAHRIWTGHPARRRREWCRLPVLTASRIQNRLQNVRFWLCVS